jgi:hypothetical protein
MLGSISSIAPIVSAAPVRTLLIQLEPDRSRISHLDSRLVWILKHGRNVRFDIAVPREIADSHEECVSHLGVSVGRARGDESASAQPCASTYCKKS